MSDLNHNFEKFEEIEHTADWALRVRGQDWPELLKHAAHGMNSLLVSETSNLSKEVEKQFHLEAPDAESLLVDWLSELAYWAEMDRLIFHEFDIQHATETVLEVTVWGGPAPALQKHIKAVTYHNLEIKKTPEGELEAIIVFDV